MSRPSKSNPTRGTYRTFFFPSPALPRDDDAIRLIARSVRISPRGIDRKIPTDPDATYCGSENSLPKTRSDSDDRIPSSEEEEEEEEEERGYADLIRDLTCLRRICFRRRRTSMMPSSSADDDAGGGGGDDAADDSEATPAPPPDVDDDDRAAPPGGLAIRPIKPTPPLAPPSFKDDDDDDDDDEENEMTKDGRRTISAGKRLSRSTGSPRRL